jgi:hypothetical protein
VRSAIVLSAGKPVIVSPTTLKGRPAAADENDATELPPSVDPRQISLFAAPWTLGSIKYTAEAGAQALTYFETAGWRGVMESDAGSPSPSFFPSTPGQVFPIYSIFAALSGFRGSDLLPVSTSQPLSVVALALRMHERVRVVIGNLTPEQRTAQLYGLSAPVARYTEISAESSVRQGANDSGTDQAADADGGYSIPLRGYQVIALDTSD